MFSSLDVAMFKRENVETWERDVTLWYLPFIVWSIYHYDITLRNNAFCMIVYMFLQT